MKFKKGFTMIEIIMVVAIAAIVFAFSVPYSLNFYRTQMLDEAESNIVDALVKARHNASIQKNDSNFGVTLSEVANSYVIFQTNTDYAGRESSVDEIYPISTEISVTGVKDVIFGKLTGEPDVTGTTTLTYGNASRSIYIYDSGMVARVESGGEVIATYSVTYNGNGSDGGTVPVDATDYEESDTVTVLGNSGALTLTGYTFDGWNTAANGSGTDYAAAATFAMGTANVTLYAQWAAVPTYSVTYNGNGSDGGTVPVDATDYEESDTVTVLGNSGALTLTGYTFDGWNTAANGSGIAYVENDTFAMGTANVTLYAQWAVVPLTVTGGTITYTDSNGLNPRSGTPYEGGYVVHTFTTNGTLTVTGGTINAEVLVVGGGGKGGTGRQYGAGGGGGAGGLIYTTSYAVTAGAPVSVIVGDGGTTQGQNGGDSVFGTLTAVGGGYGTGPNQPATGGASGGSGGGGNGVDLVGSGQEIGGGGTAGQGYAGGNGNVSPAASGRHGGGGGSRTGAGGNAGSGGGHGGSWYISSISGVATDYSRGGGGGAMDASNPGVGTPGGGGNGGGNGAAGTAAASNRGGGGGGSGGKTSPASANIEGGNGGSGIVIIRYQYQ